MLAVNSRRHGFKGRRIGQSLENRLFNIILQLVSRNRILQLPLDVVDGLFEFGLKKRRRLKPILCEGHVDGS